MAFLGNLITFKKMDLRYLGGEGMRQFLTKVVQYVSLTEATSPFFPSTILTLQSV